MDIRPVQSSPSITPNTQELRNEDVPYERVFAFEQRGALLISLGAITASFGAHWLLSVSSRIWTYVFPFVLTLLGFRDFAVVSTTTSCRVGETVRLTASARIVGRPWTLTDRALWGSDDERVLRTIANGLFRCASEGVTRARAEYGGRNGYLIVNVDRTVVEVDIPKDEPPPPEPPKVVDIAPPMPTAPAPEAKPLPPEAPPPPAAKAGALLTAPDNAPGSADDPPTFVTDPSGKEYGSGTVAKGGTADSAGPRAVATGVPGGTGSSTVAAAVPTPVVPTRDLSRKPVVDANLCKGFFPAEADDDVATVQVYVVIKSNGEVAEAKVLAENPKGQGFGRAARTCFLSKKVTPALDRDGNPKATPTTIVMRFTR